MLPDQFSNNLTEASELYKKFTRKSFQNNYFNPFVISSKAQRSINTQVSLFGTRWMPIGKHAIHYNTLQPIKAKLKNLLLQKYGQEK